MLVGMGIVGTLTAIALGFLISNANASSNATQDQQLSTSSNIIRTDRVSRLYGSDVDHGRQKLRAYASAMKEDSFPSDARYVNVDDDRTLALLAWAKFELNSLVPHTDTQRWLQPHTLDNANKLVEEHFELVKKGIL